jgi:hypothetical protein
MKIHWFALPLSAQRNDWNENIAKQKTKHVPQSWYKTIHVYKIYDCTFENVLFTEA